MAKDIAMYYIEKILKIQDPKINLIFHDKDDESYHICCNNVIISCIEIKKSNGKKAIYKLFYDSKVFTAIFKRGNIIIMEASHDS